MAISNTTDTTTSAIAKLIAEGRGWASAMLTEDWLDYADESTTYKLSEVVKVSADTLEAVTTNRDGLKGELYEQALEFDDMRAQLEAVTKERDTLREALESIRDVAKFQPYRMALRRLRQRRATDAR